MNLDEFDNIHACEETKQKTLQYVMQKQKKKSYKTPILIMTACLFLLFFFPVVYQMNKAPKPSQIISFISFDINPSMEWAINENDVIVDIISYNNDVKKLTFISSLKGKTLMEGMDLMIKDTTFQDYMKEGFLEVGIYSEQNQRENKLQEQINSYLQKYLNPSKYHCSCQNKDTFEQSRHHKTSLGKYSVIKEILQYDVPYDEQELQQKNMKELHEILSTLDEDTTHKGKHHQERKSHSSTTHKNFSN